MSKPFDIRAAPDARGGFALVLTLAFLLVLAVGALAAIHQVSAERSVLNDGEAGVKALARAELGLDSAIAVWSDASGAPSDGAVLEIDAPPGYAEVTVHRLRPRVDADRPALYAIQSRGVYTRRARLRAPEAVRTVSQLASWVDGSLDVKAGWTGLGGLVKNGGAGTIDGNDACAQEDAVAGVAVPEDPGYHQNGGGLVPTGDPPIDYLGSTPEEAGDQVEIDWEGIVDGDAIEPDLTIPPDSWPAFSDPNDWPVVYIDNPGEDFELTSAGRGILIVRGDLTVSGDKMWEGVVLVGGRLRSNGNNTIDGAAISGLNVKLGESVPVSDVGNGQKTIRYNSCSVRSALDRYSHLRPLEGTWSDSWAMY